jgi:hypothetical protein
MKTLVSILAVVCIASAFTACNSDAKMQAYKNSKRLQDSLRLDSFKRAEVVKNQQAEAAANQKAEYTASSNSNRASNVSTTTHTTVIHDQPVVVEQHKKGMSSAAKGAIIGAGAGAVTGVLVSKKDGKGAVIGGVIGAGTGYVIGRHKDKKTGRVQ